MLLIAGLNTCARVKDLKALDVCGSESFLEALCIPIARPSPNLIQKYDLIEHVL